MTLKYWITGGAALICAACASIYYFNTGPIDLLARYATPHPLIALSDCADPTLSGQRVAVSCYTIEPEDVLEVVAFLEAEYGLPKLLTHGESWHSHGSGGFEIRPAQLVDFDALANPEFVIGSIIFVADAHPYFWPSDVPKPDGVVVIPLGVSHGYITVELLYV